MTSVNGGCGSGAYGHGERRWYPTGDRLLGEAGRNVGPFARALEVGDVGEPVRRRLDDPRVRAPGQVALEQVALLVERERGDRLGIRVAEQREPSLEPFRIGFGPEAQLGIGAGCRPVHSA